MTNDTWLIIIIALACALVIFLIIDIFLFVFLKSYGKKGLEVPEINDENINAKVIINEGVVDDTLPLGDYIMPEGIKVRKEVTPDGKPGYSFYLVREDGYLQNLTKRELNLYLNKANIELNEELK